MATPLKTAFETEMQVRPDDLDFFRHVHSSKYLDYLLAARFDQMERCYGLSMETFLDRGLGWVVKTSHMEYKRPLGLGERFVVKTWIDSISGTDVEVRFEMRRLDSGKTLCLGWCHFTLVNVGTGRAEIIPGWVLEKYAA